MAVYLLLLPAILSSLFPLLKSSSALPQSTCPDQHSATGGGLICELQDLKLKVTRLESVLEESIQNLHAKSLYIEEREKLLEEMSAKIHFLESTLSNIRVDSSDVYNRITSLEEDMRLLWAASRKNNFDLHVLESKAKEAEGKLSVTAGEVEKLADIVSEQWIQIQHLEQAVQITEKRTLEAQRRLGPSKCTFLKVLGMFRQYLSSKENFTSYASSALHQCKMAFTTVKKYHHELQGLIRREMVKNEVTAVLANSELIFFMASAIVIFPIIGAWVWLSSLFC